MKTAIQELIEKNKYATTHDGGYMISLTEDEVTELLEKEKYQICNAYNNGLIASYLGSGQYYNETYKNK